MQEKMTKYFRKLLVITVVLTCLLVVGCKEKDPVIKVTVNSSITTQFETGTNASTVDWKRYFSITKDEKEVTVTDDMIDTSLVDFTKPGNFIVTINYVNKGMSFKNYITIKVVESNDYILNEALDTSDFSSYTLTSTDKTIKFNGTAVEIIENDSSVYYATVENVLSYITPFGEGYKLEETSLALPDLNALCALDASSFTFTNNEYVVKDTAFTSLEVAMLGVNEKLGVVVENSKIVKLLLDDTTYDVTYGNVTINVPTEFVDPDAVDPNDRALLISALEKLGKNHSYNEKMVQTSESATGLEFVDEYNTTYKFEDGAYYYFDENDDTDYYYYHVGDILMMAYYFEDRFIKNYSDLKEEAIQTFVKFDAEKFINCGNGVYQVAEEYLDEVGPEFTGLYSFDASTSEYYYYEQISFEYLKLELRDGDVYKISYRATSVSNIYEALFTSVYEGEGTITQIGTTKINVPGGRDFPTTENSELRRALEALARNYTYDESTITVVGSDREKTRNALVIDDDKVFKYEGKYRDKWFYFFDEDDIYSCGYWDRNDVWQKHEYSKPGLVVPLESPFSKLQPEFFVNNGDGTYSIMEDYLSFISPNFTKKRDFDNSTDTSSYKQQFIYTKFTITVDKEVVSSVAYEYIDIFDYQNNVTRALVSVRGTITNVGTTNIVIGEYPISLDSDPNDVSELELALNSIDKNYTLDGAISVLTVDSGLLNYTITHAYENDIYQFTDELGNSSYYHYVDGVFTKVVEDGGLVVETPNATVPAEYNDIFNRITPDMFENLGEGTYRMKDDETSEIGSFLLGKYANDYTVDSVSVNVIDFAMSKITVHGSNDATQKSIIIEYNVSKIDYTHISVPVIDNTEYTLDVLATAFAELAQNHTYLEEYSESSRTESFSSKYLFEYTGTSFSFKDSYSNTHDWYSMDGDKVIQTFVTDEDRVVKVQCFDKSITMNSVLNVLKVEDFEHVEGGVFQVKSSMLRQVGWMFTGIADDGNYGDETWWEEIITWKYIRVILVKGHVAYINYEATGRYTDETMTDPIFYSYKGNGYVTKIGETTIDIPGGDTLPNNSNPELEAAFNELGRNYTMTSTYIDGFNSPTSRTYKSVYAYNDDITYSLEGRYSLESWYKLTADDNSLIRHYYKDGVLTNHEMKMKEENYYSLFDFIDSNCFVDNGDGTYTMDDAYMSYYAPLFTRVGGFYTSESHNSTVVYTDFTVTLVSGHVSKIDWTATSSGIVYGGEDVTEYFGTYHIYNIGTTSVTLGEVVPNPEA